MAEETNKLSWVELKRAVAHNADISEKDVSKFMQSFTTLTVNALLKGEQVKINGLGTFKTRPVAPRKSVNVATGEAIIIKGYNKLTFTAEYNAKQKVNDTTAVTTDPMKKLSEQANEILDILADLEAGQTPQPESPKEREIPKITETPITPITPIIPITPVIPEDPEKPREPKKPRPFRPWLATGIIVSIFCIALIGGYLFLQKKIEQWVNIISERTSLSSPLTTEEDEAIDWELTTGDNTEYTASSEDTVSSNETSDHGINHTAADNITYNKFIKTETLTPGSRLAWLAYKYYGDKQLWVFIYDANKDNIAHPSHILVGTKVKIPELDSELRDTGNPHTQMLIKELEHKFLNERE